MLCNELFSETVKAGTSINWDAVVGIGTIIAAGFTGWTALLLRNQIVADITEKKRSEVVRKILTAREIAEKSLEGELSSNIYYAIKYVNANKPEFKDGLPPNILTSTN